METKKILTLCVVHQEPKILLGLKKHGFGEGRWNGFGGKVKAGEAIEAAAKREVEEEAGIVPKEIKKRGILEFAFLGEPEILEVHVFSANDFDGEPRESDEMKPQWFHVDEIPYGGMWPDDRHWLPLLLAGKNFSGKCLLDGHDTILDFNLQEESAYLS